MARKPKEQPKDESPKGFLFQKVLRGAAAKGIFPIAARQSRQWFRDKATAITSMDPRRLLARGAIKDEMKIGHLYLYSYDAKWKDTPQLPYFDKFPLMFYLGPWENGMRGLNLHYLPPELRATLMEALYSKMKTNKELAYLKISYAILKNAAKFKAFRPCYKHYLPGQLRSHFIEVRPEEWDYVLFLPLARWYKTRKARVYRDSLNKIAKYGQKKK